MLQWNVFSFTISYPWRCPNSEVWLDLPSFLPLIHSNSKETIFFTTFIFIFQLSPDYIMWWKSMQVHWLFVKENKENSNKPTQLPVHHQPCNSQPASCIIILFLGSWSAWLLPLASYIYPPLPCISISISISIFIFIFISISILQPPWVLHPKNSKAFVQHH